MFQKHIDKFMERSVLLRLLLGNIMPVIAVNLSQKTYADIMTLVMHGGYSGPVVHANNFAAVATWVPKWIPPGQMFWSVATAVFFFMAAASILSGIKSGVAAALLTAEIMGFEILVWIPKLIEAPHSHFAWAGNAIGTAIGAAAWVVADALREPQRFKASLNPSVVGVAAGVEALNDRA